MPFLPAKQQRIYQLQTTKFQGMNRNTATLLAIAIATSSAFCLPSCTGKAGKAAPTSTSEAKTAAAEGQGKIAYVCIDTIVNSYQYCKDHSEILEKRMNSIKATLNAKGKALQNSAMSFQQKVQNGEIKSEEQARKMQASLQKQQIDLENLQDKYSAQFEKERQKYNEIMKDSIENFLKDYNKDHKYSLILSKVENNILYAEKGMDITEDVLNGLNKRYKSAAKAPAADKAAKKK